MKWKRVLTILPRTSSVGLIFVQLSYYIRLLQWACLIQENRKKLSNESTLEIDYKSIRKLIDLENSYNAYFIFWTFMSCITFIMANPVAVFYLTIERCIIISFPVQYDQTKKKILIKITLFTMSLVSFILVFLYSFDYPQGSQTGID
jgi:hypothetical protein